jgi:hypothetical protein
VIRHRNAILLGSLAFAESIWLYAALALVGAVVGLGGASLPWLAVLALLLVGMLTGWMLGGVGGDFAGPAVGQAVIGLAAVYFAAGAVTLRGAEGYDLWWLKNLFEGQYAGPQIAGLIVGVIASVLLWFRAQSLVSAAYLDHRLLTAFRLGLAVIAAAVIIEQASAIDFGAGPLMAPFFAVTLAGLAVARLPTNGAVKASSWARLIALSVLGVMAIGMVLGLLTGNYGSGGMRLLYRGWELLVLAFVWVVAIPVRLVAHLLGWVMQRFNPEHRVLNVDPPLGWPISPPEGIEPATAESLFDLLRVPLSILVWVLILLALILAYKRVRAQRTVSAGTERESIQSESGSAGDLAGLLKRLLPAWLTSGGKESPAKWRIPHDHSGVVEVFKLYFDTLTAAIQKGMPFEPSVTPSERVSQLEAALPGAPVDQLTHCFNAACYGRVPTDVSVVVELRRAVDAALAAQQRE